VLLRILRVSQLLSDELDQRKSHDTVAHNVIHHLASLAVCFSIYRTFSYSYSYLNHTAVSTLNSRKARNSWLYSAEHYRLYTCQFSEVYC